MENKNKKPGFTLIELVLVMFLVSILAAISLATLLTAQAGQIFNNNFEQLVSFLNNARTDAITAMGQPDYVGGNTNNFVTPANYGVEFSSVTNIIALFADVTPPQTGAVGSVLQFNWGPDHAHGNDITLKTYTFPNNLALSVDAISSNRASKLAALDPANSSIFYSPLYADIYAQNIPIDQSNSKQLTSYPFIRIQLKEKTSPYRCRQILIHQVSGVLDIGTCDITP